MNEGLIKLLRCGKMKYQFETHFFGLFKPHFYLLYKGEHKIRTGQPDLLFINNRSLLIEFMPGKLGFFTPYKFFNGKSMYRNMRKVLTT